MPLDAVGTAAFEKEVKKINETEKSMLDIWKSLNADSFKDIPND